MDHCCHFTHTALQLLAQELHGPHAVPRLLSLLHLSPLLPELAGVWAAQVTIKNQKILAALMAAFAAVLGVAAEGEEGAALISRAQQHLADLVIKTKMKVKALTA